MSARDRNILLAPAISLLLLCGCGNPDIRIAAQSRRSSAPAPSQAFANSAQRTNAVAAPDVPLNLQRPPRPQRDFYVTTMMIQRVSVASDGSEAKTNSSDLGLEQGDAAVSADGSYVSFTSTAANFVEGDTNSGMDVFVRKTCVTGPVDCTPQTTRASVAADGTQVSGGFSSAISGDGRFVAFVSTDPLLDPTHMGQVFVRDTCLGAASGCTPTTIMASMANDGSLPNMLSNDPQISSDGRYVLFVSRATNLVAQATNSSGDIFIRDTCLGVAGTCVTTTVRALTAADGGTPNNQGTPGFASSANGRFLAIYSDATNLVANQNDTGTWPDVFWRDTCLGATGCTPTTKLVSITTAGGRLSSYGVGGIPAISGSGRYVAFVSTSELLPGGSNDGDVWLRDTCGGSPAGCNETTSKVSVALNGASANGSSGWPALSVSFDGRYVVFGSGASNLIDGDTNGVADIFVRDTCIGAAVCQASTWRVSKSANAEQANGASQSPVVTANGEFIVFESAATNLVANDTNGASDLFIAKRPR